MENASKALIIAGAILLAILIISLGILVLNQATGIINGSGMSKAELTAFNQQFTQYGGIQTGSTIRSMVQEVMSNNNSTEASDETMVEIAGVVTLSVGADQTPDYGDLKNTKTYTVTFEYKKGRVSIIHVNYTSTTTP